MTQGQHRFWDVHPQMLSRVCFVALFEAKCLPFGARDQAPTRDFSFSPNLTQFTDPTSSRHLIMWQGIGGTLVCLKLSLPRTLSASCSLCRSWLGPICPQSSWLALFFCMWHFFSTAGEGSSLLCFSSTVTLLLSHSLLTAPKTRHFYRPTYSLQSSQCSAPLLVRQVPRKPAFTHEEVTYTEKAC